MGFWSIVGNIIKSIGNDIVRTNQEVLVYMEKWADQSDEFLKKRVANGSKAEKTAAAKLLMERGWGQDNSDDE